MKQEMLINVSQPEESRIAIVEDGILEELYIEHAGADNYVGNIYKGVVVNLEPSIQAAFIDFGVGRNGFLHISDLEPSYFKQGSTPYEEERPGRRQRPGARPRVKPPIQDVLHRGDEILVQVIKEGLGSKGPTLSTYISIPGRYLVLMPAMERVGVSRKIEDEEVRRKLRDVMLELNPPKGLGFIVRTAGADRMKKELARDMTYLMRLWKNIAKRVKRIPGPVAIYEESDMIIRTIRDIFSADFDAVLIDDPSAYQRARDFVQQVMPKCVDRIQLYEGKEPIFHKFNLDKEIEKIQKRIVPLPQGGSIVIDQAEALVAIDVNSGAFRADDNAEETAYRMNLQAAKEIARQLRLRDLGGVIVNDFIDMRKDKHRRDVERALRDAVKRDRAKTKILRTSPFGLIEMTRQRIRPSVGRSTFQQCPYCHGTGAVKSVENMALEILRTLILASEADSIHLIEVGVESAVADCLNNKMRDKIIELEKTGNVQVQIRSKFGVSPEYSDVRYFNEAGQEVFIKNN